MPECGGGAAWANAQKTSYKLPPIPLKDRSTAGEYWHLPGAPRSRMPRPMRRLGCMDQCSGILFCKLPPMPRIHQSMAGGDWHLPGGAVARAVPDAAAGARQPARRAIKRQEQHLHDIRARAQDLAQATFCCDLSPSLHACTRGPKGHEQHIQVTRAHAEHLHDTQQVVSCECGPLGARKLRKAAQSACTALEQESSRYHAPRSSPGLEMRQPATQPALPSARKA